MERRVEAIIRSWFIATFAGLIYHYIGIGPNKEVSDEEESDDEKGNHHE